MNPLALNIMSGTNLAVFQDRLIEDYKRNIQPSKNDINLLENNLWIAGAEKLAPNNLVIRQYCLIDIFRKKPDNKNKIFKLLNILSYSSLSLDTNPLIFAEGYSYWKYIRDILDVWILLYLDKEIKETFNKIETGFSLTGYLRKGKIYPAPFGDLRDQPLENQNTQPSINTQIKIGIITRYRISSEFISYYIHARPIGLNTHIPKDDSTIIIVDGQPRGYTFYTGYNFKYKDIWQEIADTFDPKRYL